MNIVSHFLPPPGDYPSSETFETSKATTGMERGCLPLEFHASQPVEPGSNKARAMTAGSGRKLSALLKNRSPLGRCLKILLESSTWASTESFLNWEGSATKANRSLYRLVPSIRHKIGREFGFWPTAQSRDHKGVNQNYHDGRADALPNTLKSLWVTPKTTTGDYCYSHGDKSKPTLNLQGQLKAALWPTAKASDARQGNVKTANRAHHKQDKAGWNIKELVKANFWPTPVSSPQANRTRKMAPSHGTTHGLVLSGVLGQIANGSDVKKTRFVDFQTAFTAWEMGYPVEYLKPWETQSSGRSRRKSSRP